MSLFVERGINGLSPRVHHERIVIVRDIAIEQIDGEVQ